MKDKLPWPPQPDDATPDKFEIPANIDTFSMILLCDNKKAHTSSSFKIEV